MTAGPVAFAELTSPRAGALAAHAVVLLPVGAVEPHGPHAPLGTDTIISEEVCRRAAAAWSDSALQMLVMPPIAYGVTRFSASFPGSIGVTEQTLQALVRDVCVSLDEQGFSRRVIVNSHFEPAHVAALRDAAAATRSVLLDVTRRRLAERLTDEFRSGAAHAGRYETSMMMAVAPALVDDERRRMLPPLHVDMPAQMRAGSDSFIAMGMRDAYCGAPAEASAAEGAATLDTLATLVVELVRQHFPSPA